LERWSTLTSIKRSFHTIDLSLHWLYHSQRQRRSASRNQGVAQQERETALFTRRVGNVARAYSIKEILKLHFN
jgi:hypothetical protein